MTPPRSARGPATGARSRATTSAGRAGSSGGVLGPARGPRGGGAGGAGLGVRRRAGPAGDPRRLAPAPPHVLVHHVDAGLWLHIDAPAAVVELFARGLR